MLTIDAHPALLVVLVKLDWKVWLASLALLVFPAYPVLTHRFHCHPMDVVVGVHLDHPDLPDHLVPLDHLATKDNQADQVQLAKMATPEALATQAVPASPANKAAPAQLVMLVAMPRLVKKAIMDQPVVPANQALLAPTASEEAPENPEVQAHLVHQAPLALAANQPTKALQVHEAHPVVPAKTPNIVLAPDVPRRRKRKSRKLKWDKIWGVSVILPLGTQFLFYVKKQKRNLIFLI